MQQTWQQIAAAKKSQQKSKIPQAWIIPEGVYSEQLNLTEVPLTCGLLTDSECQITSDHDATALLEKIKKGIWSAEQVTIAFCKRAAIAQQLVEISIPSMPIHRH